MAEGGWASCGNSKNASVSDLIWAFSRRTSSATPGGREVGITRVRTAAQWLSRGTAQLLAQWGRALLSPRGPAWSLSLGVEEGCGCLVGLGLRGHGSHPRRAQCPRQHCWKLALSPHSGWAGQEGCPWCLTLVVERRGLGYLREMGCQSSLSSLSPAQCSFLCSLLGFTVSSLPTGSPELCSCLCAGALGSYSLRGSGTRHPPAWGIAGWPVGTRLKVPERSLYSL